MPSEAASNAGASQSGARGRIVVFADFDGTLVSIADRPEDIIVPPGLPGSLAGLAARLHGALAIITGRPIDAIDRFLAPGRFAVAGGHGTERRRADGSILMPDAALQAASARIGARLAQLAQSDARLVLEIKAAAVGLHFRQAPELEAVCRRAMDAAVQDEPLFIVVAGKMVLEARPAALNKGIAVRDFLAEPPFAGRLPLFVGDDRTDEDGFAVAQAKGGLGVKVGAGETSARRRLAGPPAVLDLFAALGDDGQLGNISAIEAFLDDKG
jgi:trehalose 6-phosphate phosphatase